MWKIKDPELKAKVNQFFTDKEIHEEFEKNTDLYNYFRLSTINKKGLHGFSDCRVAALVPAVWP